MGDEAVKRRSEKKLKTWYKKKKKKIKKKKKKNSVEKTIDHLSFLSYHCKTNSMSTLKCLSETM